MSCLIHVENATRLVMDECGCLPLRIVTVGGGMREVTDNRTWRSALYEVKNSAVKNNRMATEVFGCLRFSYNHLAVETVRECSLYCTLYPNGQSIPLQELVGYWIVEGLVCNEYDVDANDKCNVIISELQNACLLEAVNDDSGEEFVKMHDLVRDMAIDISRIDCRFMVHAGIVFKAPPAEEWDEGLEKVSVMNNEIEMMVGQPRCPNFLQNVSSIGLWELPRLRGLCGGTVPSGTVTNLKSLTIYDYGGLACLFSVGMLKQLQSLKVIDVCSCILMEEIFSTETEADGRGSQGFLTVDFCPMLGRLPFSAAGLPIDLKHVHGPRTWWNTLDWDHEVTKRFFNKHCWLHC